MRNVGLRGTLGKAVVGIVATGAGLVSRTCNWLCSCLPPRLVRDLCSWLDLSNHAAPGRDAEVVSGSLAEETIPV